MNEFSMLEKIAHTSEMQWMINEFRGSGKKTEKIEKMIEILSNQIAWIHVTYEYAYQEQARNNVLQTEMLVLNRKLEEVEKSATEKQLAFEELLAKGSI